MQKRVFLLHDICSAAGTILTLYMLYLYICSFMMGDYSFRPVSLCFICIMILTDCFSRRNAGNIILYILFHILPFLMLILPGIPLYSIIILGCIGFFIFYNSIVYWKKDGLEKHFHAISFPDETIIFYIIIFIHSYYGLAKNITIYVYAAGISFFIISLLQKYFNRIINEIHSANGTNRNLPDKMYLMNSILVVIFTMFILLFVIGMSLALSENSFNFIGNLLKYLGTILVSAISHIAGKKQPTESAPISQDTGGASHNNLPPIEATDNPIANALFVILQIIIYFLIVSGVIYLIYSFFKTYFYQNRHSEDIVKKSVEDADITVRIAGKRRFKNIFAPLSGKDKIRKIYYKKVCSLQKGNMLIKQSNTPDEISTLIKKSENVSIDELTSIYKKARYGNDEISKEDVAYCKNLL
ncbi:MAG: hypothetical protein HDT39_00160 [Lachnospiraceae bacterium]|nr:hypothetical protein [Lachnospiraceae bacterium]